MLSLAEESWIWYAFVVLVVIFRFTSRIVHLGSVKHLEPEDFLMLFVVCIYTVLVTFMNIVAYVDTNLMLPGDIPTLTPESIQSRIYGSKLVLLVEQCMITTQWGCKICLLLIYYKFTVALKRRWAVKFVAGYVVLGWLIMEILYFGVWCQPFSQYWAVPVDNIQCSAAIHHLIVNAVFNISSDIMMLCIPLPLLICSKLPPLKKTILCGLFGLGIFVILCAALNKYYSFTQPFSPIWTFWYIREASTAILVANIPQCWPLMRRIFNLRSFSGSTDHPTGTGGRNLGNISGPRRPSALHVAAVKFGSCEDAAWTARGGRDRRMVVKSESLEYINGRDEGAKEIPLEIWQDVEVHIQKHDANEEESVRQKEEFDGIRNGNGYFGFKTRTIVTAQPLTV